LSSPGVNLRILDGSSASKELDLASELFHRINRIIPLDQKVLTLAAGTPVSVAIALLHQHGYSQAPVVEGNEVLGVFSFRSFAREVAATPLETWVQQKCGPGELNVDEYLEQFEFARVTEELARVFDFLERDNGVLVGAPDRLIGILTPMDFLRYLYRVASPFVLISEIELALRALIHIALSPEELESAAKRSLAKAYGGEENVPRELEEMSFDNYRTIIGNGQTWSSFEPVLGGTRERAVGKLKVAGTIRNDVFHFRREISLEEHESLANHRNWLLSKVRLTEAMRKKGGR